MQPIFTIGYSGIKLDPFLDLLQTAGCTTVCDVRSFPTSRYRPEFSRPDLKRNLNSKGLKYAFFGNGLGARPKDRSCYRNGVAEYDLIAQSSDFKEALDRIVNGATKTRIALVCSEADPIECHRAILISRHLASFTSDIRHLHSDGRVELHLDLEDRLIELHNTAPPPLLRNQAERLAGLALAYDKQGSAIAYNESNEWKRHEDIHNRLY